MLDLSLVPILVVGFIAVVIGAMYRADRKSRSTLETENSDTGIGRQLLF